MHMYICTFTDDPVFCIMAGSVVYSTYQGTLLYSPSPGASSPPCLPRNSPETEAVGGTGGQVMGLLLLYCTVSVVYSTSLVPLLYYIVTVRDCTVL